MRAKLMNDEEAQARKDRHMMINLRQQAELFPDFPLKVALENVEWAYDSVNRAFNEEQS